MSNQDWQPGASIEVIRARARLLADIRRFFFGRDVLEVETPICCRAGTTDPAIESFKTEYTGPGAAAGQSLYLQTSPEFPMKRLLAAGVGSIYQICKVFRNGEMGSRHNPEFTLLEWYRIGFDHHRLMDEVEELVCSLFSKPIKSQRLTYQQAFENQLGLNPHTASLSELHQCATQNGLEFDESAFDNKDAWLDLLLSHLIEPSFPKEQLVFIVDYPASQSSLARLNPDNPNVAERFELYYGGVELANGFHELTDANEQRKRFEADGLKRKQSGQDQVPIDENLLQALKNGMPECAGVALGVDRLLMLITGEDRIDGVLGFSGKRA